MQPQLEKRIRLDDIQGGKRNSINFQSKTKNVNSSFSGDATPMMESEDKKNENLFEEPETVTFGGLTGVFDLTKQVRVGSEGAARSYANRPVPKNRFEGQLLEMQKKKMIEMRMAEREQRLGMKRLNRLQKQKYFKPNEVIRNATVYNKLPPEQR